MAAADLYCSRSDVARRLPPGSITSPAGLIASAIASTDVLTYDGHGFETGDPLLVRALEGGTLSAPLAEGTTYYAIRLTNSTFQLAVAPNGSAINLTTDGDSMVVIRDPDFDTHIEFYSRWADALMPGEEVPLQPPIHPTVRGIVADLTAKKVENINGQDSAILTAAEVAGVAQMQRFAAGLRLRGAPAAPSTSSNLAVTSTLAKVADPRGWAPSGSGTLP